MQITIEPNKMSQEQREYVAGVILNYPIHADTTHRQRFEVEVDTKQAVGAIKDLQNAIGDLPDPEAAFGGVKVGDTVTTNVPGAPPISTIVAVANNAIELDKNGFPWDTRIHSSNKAKIADGTWRKRRGIADATVAQVEAELRAVMGAPAAQVVPPPPPEANAMPPIPADLVRAPTPPAPATVGATPGDNRGLYVGLVGRTAAALHQKKITQEQVTECCVKYGVPALPLLSNRLDLVPQIAAEIDAILRAAGAL